MDENKGLSPDQENEILGKQVTKKVAKELAAELIKEEGNEKTLVIRHDDPKQELKLRERLLFAATGNIDTVSRYLAKRAHLIDHFQTTVLIDRKEMTIGIHSNETDHWGDKLTGKLQIHPDFIRFGINTGTPVQTQKLGDFFKMNRAFFVDREENLRLVTVLKTFEGSVDQKIKDIQKDNGNAHVSREQIVTSTIPPSFRLKMGLFKGLEIKEFEVNTVLSVNSTGQVVVALESPEAQEIIDTYKNEVIDIEIGKIEGFAPNLLIIEQ